MRINGIEISNFRSLKSVTMKDLGNLVVLIGPNSAGKSNLLEAMQFFFWQLHPAQYTFLSPLPDFLWHDRDTENPIVISLTLNITKNEAKKILPLAFQQNRAIAEHNTLQITRKIFGPEGTPTISTTNITFNGGDLFRDEKMPERPKLNESMPVVDPNSISAMLLTNISDQISTQFRIIKSKTNEFGLDLLGERNSVIPTEIITEITTVGKSLEKKQMKKWQNFEKNVRITSNEISDIGLVSDQVVVTEKNTDTRFPVHLVGGGNQEIVTISHQLSTENKIFGIEEPETHLNPQLARKLFQFFKDISNSKQLFIVTHSTIFVDMGDLANTWLAIKNQNGTSIKRPSQPEDLKRLLAELGTRPSDILYSNAILFVEGHSDKLFYPLIAKKLGIDFDSYGLGLVTMRGSGSSKYHLPVWTETVKNIDIPFFMILDNDATQEAEKLNAVLVKDENLFLLQKGSIEDYYPDQLLADAIKSIYGIELSPEDKKKLEGEGKSKKIKELLEEKGKDLDGWKVLLGNYIAEKITLTEIDKELQAILERIRTKLNNAT